MYIKLLITLSIAALLMFAACSEGSSAGQSGIKIPEQKVDRRQMELAAAFGSKMCRNWDSGIYETLDPDIATGAMVEQLTPERQREVFDEFIYPAYGNFRQLFYKETYSYGSNNIYRFRGAYEKDSPEVRVVITKEGKVTGFWIRPWSDELK